MTRFWIGLVLVAGCNVDVHVGDRDGGSDLDAPIAIDAPAPRADGGPPACAVGSVRCTTGGRETCVFVGPGYSWQSIPCRTGTVCNQGVCVSARSGNLEAIATAPPWTHPDIGVAPTSGVSTGSDRFPYGIYVANPWDSALMLSIEETDAFTSALIVPHAGAITSIGWSSLISQVPSTGMPIGTASSVWEPARTGGYIDGNGLGFALWYFSPASPRATLDPLCTATTPPASCFARTFEGSLGTGAQGTRFVVAAEPARAFYDRCADRIVLDGAPFIGISTTGGTNGIRVRVTAATSGSPDPSVGVMESGTPGPADAGAMIGATIYRGGMWQLVARAPTLAECAPVASTDCLEPCSAPIDLSGTTIDTDYAANVAVGHSCARRVDNEPCSYLLETLLPVDQLERTYRVPGPASFEDEAWARVVALDDATDVDTGSATFTLAASEAREVPLGAGVTISASSPIVVSRGSRRGGGGLLAVAAIAPATADGTRHLLPAIEGAIAIAIVDHGQIPTIDGTPAIAVVRAFDATHDVLELPLEASGAPHVIETSTPSSMLVAILPPGAPSLATTRGALL